MRLLAGRGGGLVAASFGLAVLLAALVSPRCAALLCGRRLLAGLRAYLRYLQRRQLLRFVAQMPELARVLSNATGAGLSIRTAIRRWPAEDLAEPPVRTEIERVVREMQVGAPLEDALLHLESGCPAGSCRCSCTLIISQRSGGSLITALRDIAATLEDRKELNREIRTLLTQATYTGYLVAGHRGRPAGLSTASARAAPGDDRTRSFGQAALAVRGPCFGVGFMLIRRMTRIEV